MTGNGCWADVARQRQSSLCLEVRCTGTEQRCNVWYEVSAQWHEARDEVSVKRRGKHVRSRNEIRAIHVKYTCKPRSMAWEKHSCRDTRSRDEKRARAYRRGWYEPREERRRRVREGEKWMWGERESVRRERNSAWLFCFFLTDYTEVVISCENRLDKIALDFVKDAWLFCFLFHHWSVFHYVSWQKSQTDYTEVVISCTVD